MFGLYEGNHMLQGLGALGMNSIIPMRLLAFIQRVLDAHAYLFLSAFRRKTPVSMSQQ